MTNTQCLIQAIFLSAFLATPAGSADLVISNLRVLVQPPSAIDWKGFRYRINDDLPQGWGEQEFILRFEFSSSQDLRKLSVNHMVGAVLEPCEWRGNSWDRPSFWSDFVLDAEGWVLPGERLARSPGEDETSKKWTYFLIVDTVPVVSGRTDADASDFDLRKNPQALCLQISSEDANDNLELSNMLRSEASHIADAIAALR